MGNVNHIEKGFMYSMMDSWLGKGLLTSTGKRLLICQKCIKKYLNF